jgi:hypothetical protein
MENRNDVFLPTIQISDFNRSEKYDYFNNLYIDI